MTSPGGTDLQGSALVAERGLAQPRCIPEHSHEKADLHSKWAFYPVQLALLAAVYFGAAKLGLTMAFVAEQVTAVWPPTGIALAALLFFGYRVWPAITLGALLANVTANEPLGTAAGIAVGNTLEALVGAWLLRGLVKFDPALGRVSDVLGLVVLAGGLTTMLSATVGVTSLCLGGVKPWTSYPAIWTVWWLGDATGDLVIAPLLLTWAGWRQIQWRPQRVAEVGTLLLALVVVTLSVFAGPSAPFSYPALAYALFPFVIWAALRFGQAPANLATAVASAIAIWGTVRGYGPFQAPTIHENLILLQLFMGVVATTTLVLAALTTERARAEGGLQRSYDLLRGVVEGTTDAVFVKDRQGRYLMINSSGARFLGKTVAEVIGKDDTELFSPETARLIMEGDRRIVATGVVQTYEDVGVAAGVTRTYLSTKGPYRDAQGNVIGLIGISRDISERKRAEERFRLMVESGPCGMLMINHDGRIVLVNALTEKMFGYSRGELLGQLVELLVPERFRTEQAASFANPHHYPPPSVSPPEPGGRLRGEGKGGGVMGVWREVCGRHRDGRELPLEIRLTPIEMEEGLFALSAIVDISERKRAEEMRSRLAAIVESSEDAMLSKDLDGIILSWNRAAERMYGYAAAEAVGQPILLLVPPERTAEVPAILEQLKQGKRLENYETVRLRKDGTRIEVALNISPMPDATGRVTAASVIGRDITSRKRSERRLAAVHAVTSALARSPSLGEAAVPILQTVGKTLRCDLGVLWEVDAAADVLRCAGVWHLPGMEGTAFEQFGRQIAFVRGEGLPGRAWDTGEPAWVPDAPFPRSVASHREGPCGALALPVRSDGNVLGVLEFFGPDLRQPDAELLPLLTSMGSQIAQFIERRHAESVVHARAREFSLARTIQQGLLPKTPPVLPGLEIAGVSHPAQETGGDYFDFIPMADGHWGIAIGDASGHGIGAALLIAETRAYLRAFALTTTDPGQVLASVNQRLVEDITASYFVTLFLGRLDPLSRSLVYSSAGHLPAYVLDSLGEMKRVLPSTSVPLGLDATGAFPSSPAIRLEPGDLLFLLSDGIVEAGAGDGPLFGTGRSLEVVRAHRQEPPTDIVAALMQEVRAWSQGALADDMTAIILKTKD